MVLLPLSFSTIGLITRLHEPVSIHHRLSFNNKADDLCLIGQQIDTSRLYKV